MVTLLVLLNTLFAVTTLELGQLTGNPFLLVTTILLVAFVSAVVVAITDVFFRDPKAASCIVLLHGLALVVSLVLLSVIAV
jgi:hypothetical protein